MPLIKRYPNRKLYDTESKQYVTLEGISELIRDGKEIRVIDNATREDLTAQTLTQVIAELEKKPGGFLPRTILSGLIQTGGDRLNSLQRNIIGTMGLWRHIDEEIRRRIQLLVEQGDLDEREGQHLLDQLLALGHPASAVEVIIERPQLDQEVEQILAEREVPSRKDLEQVLAQLDALANKLDELGEEKS
jgi:polyhydroxyalkanoate synthesis repressor PhaR